jgi:hypothetical protein
VESIVSTKVESAVTATSLLSPGDSVTLMANALPEKQAETVRGRLGFDTTSETSVYDREPLSPIDSAYFLASAALATYDISHYAKVCSLLDKAGAAALGTIQRNPRAQSFQQGCFGSIVWQCFPSRATVRRSHR